MRVNAGVVKKRKRSCEDDARVSLMIA
jgi:hypothetical protein